MTNTNSHRQIHQRPLNQPFIKPFPMHWQPLLISCYEGSGLTIKEQHKQTPSLGEAPQPDTKTLHESPETNIGANNSGADAVR